MCTFDFLRSLLMLLWMVHFVSTNRNGNEACSKCDCSSDGTVHCTNLKMFPLVDSFPANTTTLHVSHSKSIVSVPTDTLYKLTRLKYLFLQNNNIQNVSRFETGSTKSQLINIYLDKNVIEYIEPGAFDELSQLSELNLAHNRLTAFPVFTKSLKLSRLILRGNTGISSFARNSLRNLTSLESLSLEKTGIQDLPQGIFERNRDLRELTLKDTKTLKTIDEEAFRGAFSLHKLILDNTRITSLPSRWLENLQTLSLKDVPNIWQLPPRLQNIQEVHLSVYNGFLCCAFELGTYDRDCVTQVPTSSGTLSTSTGSSSTTNSQGVSTVPSTTVKHGGGGFGTQSTTGGGGWGGGRGLTVSSTYQSSTSSSGGGGWPAGGGGWGTGSGSPPTNKPIIVPTFPNVHNGTVIPPSVITHNNHSNRSVYQCPERPVKIQCTPESDAFHPCEDIMGHTVLTAVSWGVGAVALAANFIVGIVLLTSQRNMNVTRFLMCNLAFADFCLGLYIFILTCASIDTNGEYYNYVRVWQYGIGCQILGFLAVFSSELSLFTLVVVTIERYYAIVYAMHMNARLSFRKAVRAMIFGWMFSFLMAAMPLSGVSSYGQVAVCLPFDVSDSGSTAYVALLLFLNGCSFVCVMGLYAKMLLVVVQGGDMEGAPKRNDAKVAKRMFLLVFTDMLCWAPIAFFGLLAAFGLPLLTVTQSKVLLVFFFPINSICNPFLYAFFTKAFKRELFTLLSRFGFCKFRAHKYNGTLSSFLYSSRSRRNQSTADDKSTPSLKRVFTVSFKDVDQNTTSLTYSTNDYTQESDVKRQVNGVTNVAFHLEDAKPSPKSVRYKVAGPTDTDDQVFVTTTPAKVPGNVESPKSVLKKPSVSTDPLFVVKDQDGGEKIDLHTSSNDNEDTARVEQ